MAGNVKADDTFVDPKPFRPIMAIMASSSSFTASMASPSSGSSASICAWAAAFWGVGIDDDDCAVEGASGPQKYSVESSGESSYYFIDEE
jgi:hypothetical protein